MNNGEAVIDCLEANGIDTVFGIPGTQSLPLNESIANREDVRFVMARHETAVSHQAWGYAESSGRPAATVVIPGPGDMNAINGLKNALNDCTPLLHIAIETEREIRGGDGIHETPPNTYDTVVKENVTVTTSESTVSELERALAIAETPPKGPVRVGIPKNFLFNEASFVQSGKYSRDYVTSVPSDAVKDAAIRLAEATTPLIIAGGGVRTANASAELQSVAERLGAPVIPTYKGKGVFPEDHDLFAGILSVGSSEHMHECIKNTDVALGVGTDFDAVTTQQWSAAIPQNLVHITLEPGDLGTGYEPAVGIIADAKATLSALKTELSQRKLELANGGERARFVREKDAKLMTDVLEVSEPPLTSASAERAVHEVFPRDGIISVDAGGFRIWSLYVVDAYEPRGFIDTGSWATMGTGLPAAMGAQIANPEKDVLALTGGGGLLMCIQELHTIAVENIPVTVIVLNNNDYATISAEAASNFQLPKRTYEWAETPVTFYDIAENLGVKGIYAETPEEIRDAVTTSLDRDAPTLVEIPTNPDEPQAKPIN